MQPLQQNSLLKNLIMRVNMQRFTAKYKGVKETLTQIREEEGSWHESENETRIRRRKVEEDEFQADRSGQKSLLTVEPAALLLLLLLLLPAQCLLPPAEVCGEVPPRQCRTGICWGRGCGVVGRRGAPRSEPQERRMKMNGSGRLGKDSPGCGGGVVASREVQRREG